MSDQATYLRVHRALVVLSDSVTGNIEVEIPQLIGAGNRVPITKIGRFPADNGEWVVPDVGIQIPVIFEDDHLSNVFWVGGGAGGTGLSDHGALSGLADDDHPQYLTPAEASAVYAPITHPHSLVSLSDVTISAQLDGQVVAWNAGSSKWIASTVNAAAGSGAFFDVTGDVITAGTTGTIPITIRGIPGQTADLEQVHLTPGGAIVYQRTASGAQIHRITNANAITIQDAANTVLLNIDTSGRILRLSNGMDLKVYSDTATTLKAEIDGATGDIHTVGKISAGTMTPDVRTQLDAKIVPAAGSANVATAVLGEARFSIPTAQAAFTGPYVAGVVAEATVDVTTQRVPPALYGVVARVENNAMDNATPALATAYAVETRGSVSGDPTAIITEMAGLHTSAFTGQDLAVITNAYGVLMEYQTAATNNYQIYSKGGRSFLLAGQSTIVPLTLRGASGHAAHHLDVQDSAGTVISHISKDGAFVVNTATLAQATAAIDATKTAQSSTAGSVIAKFTAVGAGHQRPYLTITESAEDMRIGIDLSGTVSYVDAFSVGLTRLSFRLQAAEAMYVTGGLTPSLFVGGNKVWHQGNDGSGSLLDADLLDGINSSGFAVATHTHPHTHDDLYVLLVPTWVDHNNPANDPHIQYFNEARGDTRYTQLEYLGGSLLFQGVYPAASYDGTAATEPKALDNLHHPGQYKHGMYWLSDGTKELDFIDVDLDGFITESDHHTDIYPGDWILALDPFQASYPDDRPWITRDRNNPETTIIFQMIPYSANTLITALIKQHEAKPDPHAQYLNVVRGNVFYAPKVHQHTNEVDIAIQAHVAATDPHVQYLTNARGDARYSTLLHTHLYEPIGSVAFHEGKFNHADFLTPDEADAEYAPVTHTHPEYTASNHTHAQQYEMRSVDAAGIQAARWFIGPVDPGSLMTRNAGDVWLFASDMALAPPYTAIGFAGTSTVGSSVVLTWLPWDVAVAQDRVGVEWYNGTAWVEIFADTTAPFDTTFTHTGRTENTVQQYRIRARNAGATFGAYSTISVTTANDPPAPPATLVASAVAPTTLTLTWTASPSADRSRYLVAQNGVQIADVSAITPVLTFNVTGLAENTAYDFTVRTKDTGGKPSVDRVTTPAQTTTTNAIPSVPTSVLIDVPSSHSQLTLRWVAPIGLNDLSHYEVFKGGVTQGTTTSTFYTFTGLTGSTPYTLGVRSVDTRAAVSATISDAKTTLINPDTTAPGEAIGVTWKPYSATTAGFAVQSADYGKMRWTCTMPIDGDLSQVKLYTAVQYGAWTLQGTYNVGTHFTVGGAFSVINAAVGTAGQLMRARLDTIDSAGNVRQGTEYQYSLLASPIDIYADDSASWRNSGGGHWDYPNNGRVYQGYYTDSSLAYRGCWFYGNKFQDYFANRTVHSAGIYMKRSNTSGNNNPADDVEIWRHSIAVYPGPITGAALPTFTSTGTGFPINGGTMAYNGERFTDVTPYMANLISGVGRGLGIAEADGKPYLSLLSVTENSASGRVTVWHLG